VKTSSHPKSVTLWQANNPDARDFRLMTIGKAYRPTTLKDDGGGVYVAKVEKPDRGWTASFVELAFDVGASSAFKVSTAVRVTPDTLPHADLDPVKAPAEKPHPKAAGPREVTTR
jgi:PhoPQ-activated pathogenicity-related protein